MTTPSRRNFLRTVAATAGSTAALAAFPASIRRALEIPANNVTGTIQDVEHIVLLMMENRGFDHYFGSMNGVRGFADRFPIPVPDVPGLLQGKTVWYQRNDKATGTSPKLLSMQYNDTTANFALMRTADVTHLYPDTQDGWDHGRMSNWPQYKKANSSMVYYKEADIPFQFALANAFTICDANHASFFGGTAPNRTFQWTGTNHGRDDPSLPGIYNGPAVENSYGGTLTGGKIKSGYSWMTYGERLEDAGISWQTYQNNEVEPYGMNSILGFKAFRDANAASVPSVSPTRTPRQQALYEKGVKTRDIDLLKQDVLANKLASVVWVCPHSSQSEHPGASSPAQGAAYIASVLDALTSNPEVWSKTVFIVNFDENDGFFDHMVPPAPPSYISYNADPALATMAGATTVDVSDDYLGEDNGGFPAVDNYKHRPWGMGPRVPMYIVSPWSKGGWVNSQVFDHTSTLRFIEQRFGVKETNISPWRRVVSGDLTSCFNFKTPNNDIVALPDTAALDAKSRTLTKTTTPPVVPTPVLPVQAAGVRQSRALPYELHVNSSVVIDTKRAGATQVGLRFTNTGSVAAVFHVYDRLHLTDMPRRYTVEAGKELHDVWTPTATGAYDLWVLAPNGFHRHFTGNARRAISAGQPNPDVTVTYDTAANQLTIKLVNTGPVASAFSINANAYFDTAALPQSVAAHSETVITRPLETSSGWYDFSVRVAGQADYIRRFAGRLETGAPSITDPAMQGQAIGDQFRVVG
ncbi:MAG: Phospholipase phosphocholine-specific [Rhizobacter sp.]|nr:Phospholipase phosphocholine-specific [Rhizobacter sp.]